MAAARLIIVGAFTGIGLIVAAVAWLWPKETVPPLPPPPIIIPDETQ